MILRAGADALVTSGATPGLGFGLAIRLGLRRGAISAELQGRADLSTSERAPGGGAASASFFAATLAPCVHEGLGYLCALATIGALVGSGVDVPRPRDDTSLLAAAGLRIGLELPVTPALAVALHGDASPILTPTTLLLDGRDVWTTAPMLLGAGAGVLVSFP